MCNSSKYTRLPGVVETWDMPRSSCLQLIIFICREISKYAFISYLNSGCHGNHGQSNMTLDEFHPAISPQILALSTSVVCLSILIQVWPIECSHNLESLKSRSLARV